MVFLFGSQPFTQAKSEMRISLLECCHGGLYAHSVLLCFTPGEGSAGSEDVGHVEIQENFSGQWKQNLQRPRVGALEEGGE